MGLTSRDMGLADWFRSNRFSSTNSLSGDVDPDADLAIQRSGTKPGAGRGERAAAYMSEPESIAKSYFVVAGITGERKYYDDYRHFVMASWTTETKIMTKRDDLRTIRAMLEIAEARGWHSVEIKGSAEFRREAWIEASARGLEGWGFTPSDADRQEADRRSEQRQQANWMRATERTQASVERAEAHEDRAAARENDRRGVSKEQARGHEAAAATLEKQSHERQPMEPERAGPKENRQTIRDVQRSLSGDGKLFLAALSDRIDREGNRLGAEAKRELKAFAAREMMKREATLGPTVLSQEQRRAATEPSQVAAQSRSQERRAEPEMRLSL